jgi:hypothetical protein
VALVLRVIDLARYPVATHKRAGSAPLCVGWIGQRATASFLVRYASLFERLSAEGLARFAAIGIYAQSVELPLASRHRVKEQYCIQVTGSKLAALLKDAAKVAKEIFL